MINDDIIGSTLKWSLVCCSSEKSPCKILRDNEIKKQLSTEEEIDVITD